jgi:hypothetical protein
MPHRTFSPGSGRVPAQRRKRVLVATAAVAVLFASWSAPAVTQDTSVVGTITDERISESSGLAVSREAPDCLWVHNDSGDSPRIFLIEATGRTRNVVELPDAAAVDWEDMCSFTLNGVNWLLIADVGDNQRQRSAKNNPCSLYLLREPAATRTPIGVSAAVAVTIRLNWDGGAIDCESVAVDTERQEILLLEKASPFQCRLYVVPLDISQPAQERFAAAVANVAVPYATAIDVSPDNRSLAIATMWGGMMFRRQDGESWTDAVSRVPEPLILPKRRQGESICFSADGACLYLNSEGISQPLHRVPVTQPQPTGRP